MIKFICLYLIVLDWLVSGGSNPCFQNGYSPLCTELIRSRYNLTFETFERVRNHIKLLSDAGRLRTPSDGPIHPFEMAMGCYAIGQRVPADDCASCAHCTQQQTAEVCDVFCPLIAAPASKPDATNTPHEHTISTTNFVFWANTSTAKILLGALVVLVAIIVVMLTICICILRNCIKFKFKKLLTFLRMFY